MAASLTSPLLILACFIVNCSSWQVNATGIIDEFNQLDNESQFCKITKTAETLFDQYDITVNNEKIGTINCTMKLNEEYAVMIDYQGRFIAKDDNIIEETIAKQIFNYTEDKNIWLGNINILIRVLA